MMIKTILRFSLLILFQGIMMRSGSTLAKQPNNDDLTGQPPYIQGKWNQSPLTETWIDRNHFPLNEESIEYVPISEGAEEAGRALTTSLPHFNHENAIINNQPALIKFSAIYLLNPIKDEIDVISESGLDGDDDNDDVIDVRRIEEKRARKVMDGVWGKRRAAVWNKFRGAWGKREPSWNNLKGMWGKRAGGDWKKLQPAWGKRSETVEKSLFAN